MKKLSFVLCMFIHSAVMSQVFLTDGRSELHTYVQAIVGGDTVLRDSIFLGFMKDHSCTAIGNQVFCTYTVVYRDDETSLHVNTYELPLEGPLVLTGRNCIVAEDSPKLFEKGIRLSTTQHGILVSLESTEVSSVFFPYRDFDFLSFKQSLETWGRYFGE